MTVHQLHSTNNSSDSSPTALYQSSIYCVPTHLIYSIPKRKLLSIGIKVKFSVSPTMHCERIIIISVQDNNAIIAELNLLKLLSSRSESNSGGLGYRSECCNVCLTDKITKGTNHLKMIKSNCDSASWICMQAITPHHSTILASTVC